MRITSIQLEIRDRPKEKNLEYVLSLIDQAPPSDLILLPEIWPCGYFSFDRYKAESEPLDGPTVGALQKKAFERGSYILMGSIVEIEDEDLFNTSLLLNPRGQIIARYRKIHLFGYQSREKTILTPGKEVVVADTPWGMAGMSTCYDLRFPELYRRMVDQGAELFLVPSAWPYERLNVWSILNRARALENLAYLFSCNCAGNSKGHQYAGHSMFIDPLGGVIAEGGKGESFVSAEIDPDLVNAVRKDFGALADRVFR